MCRRGFTLTELLIVIAIIAVLAGLLMPALVLVKREANTLKCSSNMRQIAMAIEVYRQNADGTYPGNFHELVQLYQLPPKVLLCPFDKYKGTSALMGRASGWENFDRLHLYQQVPTSYDYECSGWVSDLICTGPPASDPTDINFFYRDLPTNQRPATGTVSWADGKEHEQKFGNYDANNNFGQPFPPGNMPIIRCYYHADWEALSTSGIDTLRFPSKINNISMDFNQIWTIPYWEKQYNPNLP